MRQLAVPLCVILIGGLFVPTDADQIVLNPIVARAQTSDGVNWVVETSSGGTTLNAWRSSVVSGQRRGILEYPLDSIPADVTVTSASLSITVSMTTSASSKFQFHGYTGNGIMEGADATVPFNAVGLSPYLSSCKGYTVDIDASYIQSLLDGSAPHLGMMMYQYYAGGNTSISAFSGISPRLTVVYVPTPPSALLLALGALPLIIRRRRPHVG